MSEELRKCPICELNYRPNSHRFIDPRLCPHHEDSVWRNKYDVLVAERDALKKQAEVLLSDQLFHNIYECLEILKPLEVQGESNTLVALVRKAMSERDALFAKLEVAKDANIKAFNILSRQFDELGFSPIVNEAMLVLEIAKSKLEAE